MALPTPFTSDLSGQDFAKLMMAGWVPVGLALGISVGSRHDDWLTVGQTRWGAGNAEVIGYTELVNDARHDGRVQLEQDVRRLGGEGVVVSRMDMRVHERECPMQEGRKDHVVEVTVIGTATAQLRFAREPGRRAAWPSCRWTRSDGRPPASGWATDRCHRPPDRHAERKAR